MKRTKTPPGQGALFGPPPRESASQLEARYAALGPDGRKQNGRHLQALAMRRLQQIDERDQ
ncbi:hypothetical protein [Hymenobacter sp. B81]|uniref:hypothetical protein n=1 Tax=Hymenobacter sp. B81 TaxID=3344878 RepID=UPI0037DC5086